MLTEITNVVRPGEPAGLSRDEPWQAMKEAMSSRIQELKRFTHLRIEGGWPCPRQSKVCKRLLGSPFLAPSSREVILIIICLYNST